MWTILKSLLKFFGFHGGSVVKRCRRCGLDPWIEKISWRRKWQPTLVFLPGGSHGQGSLVGYSPWGHKRVRHDWAAQQQQQIVFVTMFFLFYVAGYFCFVFFFSCKSCGILATQPGISNLHPSASKRWSLDHWTAREVPWCVILNKT